MDHWLDHSDYRAFLKALIEEQKKLVPGFKRQMLSDACKIQKGYLSRALQLKVDLSRDQIFLLAEELHLDKVMRQFLFLLHDHNRSGLERRRQQIQREINFLKLEFQKTEKHIRPAKVIKDDVSEFVNYFLDANAQIIHMLLTIPKFRDNITIIEELLKISRKDLQKIVSLLKVLSLIEIKENKIRVLSDETHLPADHPIFPAYRTLMRAKSLAKLQSLDETNAFSYNAIFSAPKTAKVQVQRKFLVFLKEIQDEVSKGKSEEVFQLNFDILKWT